jgi:hypothetical protein
MNEKIRQVIGQELEKNRNLILGVFDGLTIDYLIERKNPYLLAFVDFDCEMIESCLYSILHSSLETQLGGMLENIAIAICGAGAKSGTGGVDLDVIRAGCRLLISVKSGEYWGNSQSTTDQGRAFAKAKKVIASNVKTMEVLSVMGICYSKKKTTTRLKYTDLKLSGQNFWYVLSGDIDFYKKLAQAFALGAEDFKYLLRDKLEETKNRLCNELRSKYEGPDKWNTIVEKCCKNYSPKDKLVAKLTIGVDEMLK